MNRLRRTGLALLGPALAIVVALVISAIVILLIGEDPLAALGVMTDLGDSPSQQVQSIVVILNRAVPLFLAGLAVSIAFRMGLFNIGVEGQYRLATILAAAVGAAVTLPGPLHVLLIVVVAMLVGAFWAGIVGVLKVTRGVSEVISSIMLNFVALGIASFLLTGPLQGSGEGESIVTTRTIPESGWFPGLNGVLTALGLAEPRSELYGFLLVAVVVGVLVAVLLTRTRFGFDLRATGISPSAATASGVDARGMVVKTMLLSGGIAGLIGLPDLLGDTHEFGTEFTAGLGFLGIAVALLGRNGPLGIAFAALLFAFLDRAALPLQFADIPLLRGLTSGVGVLTVLAVLLIPASYVVLWRTAFGLRLRSCGENPAAADSLGVPVYRLKYIAVLLSGALAGLGGVFLVFIANIYREGQTGGRGFIGLAALIFGNWRPGGLAAGAGLFGFADALQLRSRTAVVALLLLVAVALLVVAVLRARRGSLLQAVVAAAFAAAALAGYLTIDRLPEGIVFFTPHLITLLVLSLASQRLRMPKADGLVYRRGEH